MRRYEVRYDGLVASIRSSTDGTVSGVAGEEQGLLPLEIVTTFFIQETGHLRNTGNGGPLIAYEVMEMLREALESRSCTNCHRFLLFFHLFCFVFPFLYLSFCLFFFLWGDGERMFSLVFQAVRPWSVAESHH
jgi:hypothetical protein